MNAVLRYIRSHIDNHQAPPRDRYAIAKATGLSFIAAHEAVADLEWRGLLRRHGPNCSGIALTPRGIAATGG